MADKQPPQTPSQSAKAAAAARKQARLSEALKANMARRKGQARARATEGQSIATGTAQHAPHKED
jgi:hypothetical protein